MGWIGGGTLSSWVTTVVRPPRRRGRPRGPEGSDGSATAPGPSWTGFDVGSLDLDAAATVVRSRGPAAAPPPARARADIEVPLGPRPGAARGGGDSLGGYRLIERVGRGRQADVWRAACPAPVAEEVALKVLPASTLGRDPRRRAQLRHEAERGARLAGPSLLPTYEYGEVDGAAFMAMPLVVGCTLAAVIAQRQDRRAGRAVVGAHRLATEPEPAYVRDVAALMARVARAAHDAHAGLVVHRDIKPGNVLVRRDHAAGVFLCDFGLARDLDVATPSQLRDGAGSPLYMAPERLLKRPADEVRGDVFALGVTLCEALTLATPVEVPPDMPRHLWASYLAAATPRRPSALRPGIPPPLEATILRATARDPGLRHPTAAAFADDLDRFLAATADHPAPRG